MHSAPNEEVLVAPYQILSVAMATKTVVFTLAGVLTKSVQRYDPAKIKPFESEAKY